MFAKLIALAPAIINNLIGAYRQKSLLRSSEAHASILAAIGVIIAQLGWISEADWNTTIGPSVVTLVTYAILRISGKAAAGEAK